MALPPRRCCSGASQCSKMENAYLPTSLCTPSCALFNHRQGPNNTETSDGRSHLHVAVVDWPRGRNGEAWGEGLGSPSIFFLFSCFFVLPGWINHVLPPYEADRDGPATSFGSGESRKKGKKGVDCFDCSHPQLAQWLRSKTVRCIPPQDQPRLGGREGRELLYPDDTVHRRGGIVWSTKAKQHRAKVVGRGD